MKQNITLIGMAGAGKSSAGAILAHSLGWSFQDIDKLIEEEQEKPLQNILNELGDDSFMKEESSKIKELSKIQNAVIAPGGSIVYSGDAMELLKNISTVVYIRADLKSIEERIDADSRGIVGLQGKTFEELFNERENLYKHFADITINSSQKTPEEVAAEIVSIITHE